MNDEIINKIKKIGYWRVIIRPSKSFYKKDRFEVKELSKIIHENYIRLRGWYYPHIDLNGVESPSQNTINNSYDLGRHIGYWEFTTSGQFSHIFSIEEDYIVDEKKAQEIKTSSVFNSEKTKDINKFLEVVSTVYRLTEIYLFATNLAQLDKNKDVKEFETLIELYGIQGRMLFFWDWGRDLFSPHVCNFKKDKISFSKIYEKDDLISKYNDYAIEDAIKLFNSFGWLDPNRQVIENDQKKLIERRL